MASKHLQMLRIVVSGSFAASAGLNGGVELRAMMDLRLLAGDAAEMTAG